ncbi:MAG: four helix bundle protein [Candidatus Staskawiczbacteria bacterium]|jgi:four helix bundle protein
MENKIKNFYELEAWQEGHKLVLDIYKITAGFPLDERFGVISQLRRASSSITANIAEGFDRYHFNDKIRFYYQSRGSVGEVQNFMMLSCDLKFIDGQILDEIMEKCNIVRRLINGLIRSIENQK